MDKSDVLHDIFQGSQPKLFTKKNSDTAKTSKNEDTVVETQK